MAEDESMERTSTPTDGPRITAILSNYNSGKTLGRAIDSVVNQEYEKKEIIVIDGGSTDASVDVLEKYDEHLSYWHSEPDDGIYDAWNKGVREATGDWLCFIGADDRFAHPRVFTGSIPHLREAYPEARVVYGNVIYETRDGFVRRTKGKPWDEAKEEFQYRMSIPHPGTYHHQDLFADHGLFDESFELAGDYEFLLRELLHRPAYYAEDLTCVIFSMGGASYELKNIDKKQRELERIRERYELDPPLRESVNSRVLKRWGLRCLLRIFGPKHTRSLVTAWRRIVSENPSPSVEGPE